MTSRSAGGAGELGWTESGEGNAKRKLLIPAAAPSPCSGSSSRSCGHGRWQRQGDGEQRGSEPCRRVAGREEDSTFAGSG